MIQQEAETAVEGGSRQRDPVSLQVLFFYIYFMQGIIFSISSTMPYIYPQLPSYSQMPLFFASLLPWSLKFLISPFLEKYTSIAYGKRKTWLIISKLVTGALLYLASRFTDYEEINTFASLLILINFAMVLHNIASESLSIKHFKNKQRIGILQILGDYGGAAIGGLMMMKLTNPDFAHSLGLPSAIAAPSTIILIYTALLLSSVPVIHFWFSERRLRSEDVSHEKSLCTIVQYNGIFFEWGSQYFRIAVFLLLYMLGINFYLASYEYQLIDSGFSRNDYNSIENISMLLMIGVTLFMEQHEFFQGRVRSLSLIFGGFILNMLLMLLVFSLDIWAVSFSVFLNEFLYAWRKYIIYELVNNLPLHGVAGMYLTTLTSLNEFAEVKSLHSEAIELLGYKPCLLFGLCFQVGFLLALPRLNEWLESGRLDIDEDIQEKDEKSIQDQQDLPDTT